MTRRPDWWRDVFNRSTFLELYERSDTQLAVRQADQITSRLGLAPPARILDLPCGYGRHALELTRRGFQVAGVDISPLQIGRACARAVAAGLGPRFVIGDVRALPLAGPFDAAINMFLSFGYFETDEENLAMLHGIARVLRAGGRLLIDFWNREREIRGFQDVVVDKRDDGIYEIEEWSFDPLGGRLNWTNTVIFPDGRREAWAHSIRAFTIAEVKKMLEAAGMRLLAVYGNLDGAPYALDADAAIFLAEKQ
jgi:SAM-dependent methyltransferase